VPPQKQNQLVRFYDVLKSVRHSFDPTEIIKDFSQVSEQRVDALAAGLSHYIGTNLPAASYAGNWVTV
jgi:hypothetical protein